MQILLTGATGFLGQAIAASLIEQGHRVRAIVRRETNALAKLGVEQRYGQATVFEDVCVAADGCEAIVHSAGCSDPLASIEQFLESNTRSTDCMLGACELVGVPRLLLTSCANVVIGQSDLENVDERQAYPEHWSSAYAHSKALAEQRVLAANSASLATCVLRPHLLWGAGEARLLPCLISPGAASCACSANPSARSIPAISTMPRTRMRSPWRNSSRVRRLPARPISSPMANR
jgi:2-alkyl-3-oxoalkanoate reductase